MLEFAKELLIRMDNVYIPGLFENPREYVELATKLFKKLKEKTGALELSRKSYLRENPIKFWYHKNQLASSKGLLKACVLGV